MWPFGRRRRESSPNTGDDTATPKGLSICRQGTSGDGSLGRRGEELAGKFLRKLRYTILAANYRCPNGEVDLIALDPSTSRQGGETIVFVEVKTRNNDRCTAPESAVDERKQHHIRAVAKYYLSSRDTNGFQTRFDIVSIVLADGLPPRIKHIVAAF